MTSLTPAALKGTPAQVAARSKAHGYGSFLVNMHRWLAWDSAWYMKIVTKGYVIVHHFKGQETIAFFPMFPTMVRIVSDIFHISYTDAGLACNFLLVIGTVFFLYKITEQMATQAKHSNPALLARVAVLLLLFNPSSFFFASFYADALLVFCVTVSFYFALRHSFIWAAVFAGLASGTKSTGALLLPVLLVMYAQAHWSEIRNLQTFIRKHLLRLVAVCILSEAGIIAYMGYLWYRFRQPLVFVKDEKYWDKGEVSPLHAIGYIWQHDYEPLPHLVHWYTNLGVYELYVAAIPLAILLLVLYILIRHGHKYGWLALFSFLAIAVPMATGQLASLNRYVLVLTPLFSWIAVYFYGSKRPYLRYGVQAWLWLSVLLLIMFTTSFLSGYFMG